MTGKVGEKVRVPPPPLLPPPLTTRTTGTVTGLFAAPAWVTAIVPV